MNFNINKSSHLLKMHEYNQIRTGNITLFVVFAFLFCQGEMLLHIKMVCYKPGCFKHFDYIFHEGRYYFMWVGLVKFEAPMDGFKIFCHSDPLRICEKYLHFNHWWYHACHISWPCHLHSLGNITSTCSD